jgi:hypothetical protein
VDQEPLWSGSVPYPSMVADPVHHVGGCIRTECCISHISRLLDDKRDREGVRCVVHGSRQPDGLTLHIAALSARKLRSSSIHA